MESDINFFMTLSVSAIILAAGEGRRMGRTKPLLPLGEETVIAHLAGSFRAAGVEDIMVVIGHCSRDIIPALQINNLDWVKNDQYKQGMLSSVKTGIQALARGVEAFFIMPADIPLVRPLTLKALKDTHAFHTAKIIYPAYQGRRGHPPLISARFKAEILKYRGSGGLRRCLSAWERDSLDVAVADQGTLMDMDTPEDYTAILDRLGFLNIPSKEESLALLAIHQPDNPSMRAHARMVASVATTIGHALNKAGSDLNLALIEAAAILHDIAKGQPRHDQRGAELIAAKGFQLVSDVAAQHMDLVFDPENGIHEAAVVFLADKMVSGSDIVLLEKRIQWKKKQFSADPEALKMMTFRMEQAVRIREAVEQLLGEPVDGLL
jgi:molybdenum cofactor cytidylyltransferase